MTRQSTPLTLDERLERFFAAQADAAATAAPSVEEATVILVGRLRRGRGLFARLIGSGDDAVADGHRRPGSRLGSMPLRRWALLVMVLAALIALVAGSLLVASRPRPLVVVVPPRVSPSASPTAAPSEPFSLGGSGSIVVARLADDRLTVVSVDTGGTERTLGVIDGFASKVAGHRGWVLPADPAPGTTCIRFCLPSIRLSSAGLIDVQVVSGPDILSGPSHANVLFDLLQPDTSVGEFPPGVAAFEADGTLVLEEDPGDGTAAIERSGSPLIRGAPPISGLVQDRTLPLAAGESVAFSQFSPLGFALAADGTGVLATKIGPDGSTQYVIAHWDGSTERATGAAPMFVTGSDRILGADGTDHPFFGLWDRAGDVSCGPVVNTIQAPLVDAQIGVDCAGPDNHPSQLHPASKELHAGVWTVYGVEGFTDSAALLAVADATGDVIDVVPLDGSPQTEIRGLLIGVVP